jgi:hypothetical protein
MSGINGDKSRFNRQRKQRIALRLRNQKRLKGLPEQAKSRPAAAVNELKGRTA